MDSLKGKLKHCDQLISSLNEEKLNNEKTIIGLKDKNNELLNSLRKIASDRLTHDFNDITDLSDETLPSKLTEKMSELYDNQWSHAFDEMKANGVEDEKAISILLNIVMEINQVCKTMAFSHFKKLKAACTCFEYSSSTDAENKEKIIEEKIAERFEIQLLHMTQTPLYIKECAELCWMMNMQEKPMHLDINVPEKDGHKYFDTEKFISYTKTGQHVVFVVWPALYSFDGDSLLKKRVAQGLKVEKGSSGQYISSVSCF